MRNIVLAFFIFLSLTSCVSNTNLPTMVPKSTSTPSPTKLVISTNVPTLMPTLTPITTPAQAQYSPVTHDEIVDFMVSYIVENEIEAMIDIINSEDIPLIDKPPAQFIVISSPISQTIENDYSNLMNALETRNAEKVWIYQDSELTLQADAQKAIQDYQEFIRSAPKNPSIFMWGYNEFGIVSIADDGKKAKVYLAATCGSLCGHGLLMFLEKNGDDQWELIDILSIWGS